MTTVDQALAETAARLGAAGVPEPRLEARVLAAAALDLTREAMLAHGDAVVDATAAARLAGYVTRRAAGEPAARILGRKEFWSLEFEVTADTLVPRPETETLVEAALASAPERGAALSVLDLGTGTGCLLLALLSELPNARGLGVDLNPGAVAVARRNASKLGLADRASFVCGDFATTPVADHPFDIVVSNPPYIVEDDIAGLSREVARFEPRLALAGGRDGLAAYRVLAARLPRLLAPSGTAFLEIGQGQDRAVVQIMADEELTVAAAFPDLAGIVRCLTIRSHRLGEKNR
jgi:release factor glutamine methyltransferase